MTIACAEVAQQDQADAAVEHFLVHAHQLERPLRADPRRRRAAVRLAAAIPGHGRQSAASIQPSLADIARGHQHAHGHAFAVQPFAVTGGRFDRVPERMAEVEQCALAVFALVGGDDARLDLAGPAYGVGQRGPVEPQQVGQRAARTSRESRRRR